MEKILSTRLDPLIATQMKELKNIPSLPLSTAIRETLVRMSTLYLPDQ